MALDPYERHQVLSERAFEEWPVSFTPPKVPDEMYRHEDLNLTPVWVLLDSLCIRVPGAPMHTMVDGLDMTGQVSGLLRSWHKTAKGDWLGMVNYSVPYADPHQGKLRLSNQLVPSYALRPRESADNKQ